MTTQNKPMTKAEADEFRGAVERALALIEEGHCVWAAIAVTTTDVSIKLSSRNAPKSVKLTS